MSEPSAGAADVTASTTEQSVEHQPQPERQAVAQRPLGEAAQEQTSGGQSSTGEQALLDRAAASAQASDLSSREGEAESGTGEGGAEDKAGAPPDPPDVSLDQTIGKLTEEAAKARTTKEQADSTSADVDNRLTILLAVQREFEATLAAYESAYSQLEFQEKAFSDYLESEKKSLEDDLGTVAAEVVKKAAAREAKRTQLEEDVKSKLEGLKTAESALSTSKDAVKAATDRLGQLKKLAATVTARYGILKTLRDEETKTRQLGQYALAYWLLDHGFRAKLNEEPKLIKPAQLEPTLIAAVNALADAQVKVAQDEKNLAKSREELALAQKALEEHKTKSEAELRDELQQMPTNDAATRGDTDNA